MTEDIADQITIRAATSRDTPAVDAVFAVSYPTLLKPDYPPSVLVTALPLIARANPALLRSGSYYVALDGEGRIRAAGGWTHSGPQGGVGPRHVGHIRHVVTHPDAVRRGFGSALMRHVLCAALRADVTDLRCQSTRTAVPFYQALGFRKTAEIEIALRPGITFPAVEMSRRL